MSTRRQPAVNPVVVLAIIALIPGVVLFLAWRWAAGRAEGAEPPPVTSVAPPAPAAPLTTPLLSLRRAPGVLSRDLKVMDASAISLMRENRIPIVVFSIRTPGALLDVLTGQGVHTVIEEMQPAAPTPTVVEPGPSAAAPAI